MYWYVALFFFVSKNSWAYSEAQIIGEYDGISWDVIFVVLLILGLLSLVGYLWLLNLRLLTSKHKLNVIWRNIPDILTEVDGDGSIYAINHPINTSLSVEDVIGTSCYDYIPDEYKALVRDGLNRALTESVEVDYEMELLVDNVKRTFKNRIVPLLEDDGDETDDRLLLISTDITEHKIATHVLQQAKLQADESARSKVNFLAHMSHEIRTPLGGIIAMATLLHEQDEAEKEFTEPLLNSANHLEQIVNDVLDLAKSDAGAVKLHLVDISLWQILDDLEALYAPQAASKDIRLEVDLKSGTPRYIRTDAFRLRQILYNLLSNAIKFTQQGCISIVISSQNIMSKPVLKFSIKDTGVGIEKEHKERIFDVYSQVNAGVSHEFGGTGLGLTICRNLVGVMGGVIGVESESGQGSEFWFTLPLQAAEKDEETSGLPNICVGLAIQNKDKQRWFKRFFASLNIDYSHIDHLASSSEGFDLIVADHDIDLAAPYLWWVGLDYDLPNMAGIVLFTPYRREALVNRLLTYLDELQTLSNAHLHQESGDSEKSNTQHKQQNSQREDAMTANRVLVVEDNVTNQLVIKKSLEKIGYQVTLANNGEEGLAAFTASDYQGVIMDVQMPVMDGIEATRLIRQKEGRYVPIIALTANAQDSVEEACFAAGMDAFLTKPINRVDLKSTLQQLIGGDD